MWPFNSKKDEEITPEKIQDAIDELGIVRLNGLQSAVEKAVQKHLDPSSLDHYNDDTGGHFDTEFELFATASRMKGVYRREPWVYTATSLIARTLSTVPFDIINRATGEIDDQHPMNDTIKAGNNLQDNISLRWSAGLDLVLAGNAFLIRDGDDILHVPIEYVQLNAPKGDKKRGSKYPIESITITRTVNPYGGASDTTVVPWEDVIHLKMPNPYNPFVGLSMIAAAARPILLDRHKNEFEMAFYLRGATNAGVIETTEDITKQRMERLMRTFETAFTGRRNWFRQMFLPKGAKWVNAGLTMAEMEHLEGLRENRLTLLAVIGVPPSKVGIVQDVNRATAEVQDATFWENTIIPLSSMWAAGWNNSPLVKEFYKGEVEVVPNFDGIDAVEGGIITRGEQAKALDNIAVLNEQRIICGLPPLKPSDPRGNMFTIELASRALNPFATQSTARPEDMGPEDDNEPVGEIHYVELGTGDGENEHTHMAEVDDLGNGITTDTNGEGPDHEHEIIGGDVQVGGVDGHSHPSVDVSKEVEEEKQWQRVKQIAVGVQESIEKGQSRQFLAAYRRNLQIKLTQTKVGLREGISDMRTWLNNGIAIRVEQYQDDAEKVLQDSMSRGFTFGMTQTKGLNRTIKKAFNFSAQDEMAIDIIKARTEDEQRRTLEERNITNYFGFDGTTTEQIQQLIENGLKEDKTTEQIAKTIEQDFGENYGDQAFTVARTETLYAVSQGLNWQHETLSEVFTEVAKQWFHVGDVGSNPDARKGHALFEKSGKKGVVPSDFVWVNSETGGRLRYPRDPNAGPEDTINCRCSMVSVIPKTAQSNAETIINRGG